MKLNRLWITVILSGLLFSSTPGYAGLGGVGVGWFSQNPVVKSVTSSSAVVCGLASGIGRAASAFWRGLTPCNVKKALKLTAKLTQVAMLTTMLSGTQAQVDVPSFRETLGMIQFEKEHVYYYGGFPPYIPDQSVAMGQAFADMDYIREDRIYQADQNGLFDFSHLHDVPKPTVLLHGHAMMAEDLGFEVEGQQRAFLSGYGSIVDDQLRIPYQGELMPPDPLLGGLNKEPVQPGLVVKGILNFENDINYFIRPIDPDDPVPIPWVTGRGLAHILAESLRTARAQGANIAPIKFVFSGCSLQYKHGGEEIRPGVYAPHGHSFIDDVLHAVDEEGHYVLGEKDVIYILGATDTTKSDYDSRAMTAMSTAREQSLNMPWNEVSITRFGLRDRGQFLPNGMVAMWELVMFPTTRGPSPFERWLYQHDHLASLNSQRTCRGR